MRPSVIVLTLNEEQNLPACLRSVADCASQVFVVDSGSTDATIRIASEFGAQVVTHAFQSHSQQWEWALATLPVRSPWVLALDADQSLTPELRASILRELAAWDESRGGAVGYYLNRRQIFRGRWIRHGGYYPKYLLKLFRRDAVRLDAADLVDHHFHVSGPTSLLNGDLIEENHNENEIAAWVAKHNRYAILQAREEQARPPVGERSVARAFGSPDERTRWQKRVWNRLPLYIRPFGYFFYRYILRLGFLDGKEGFVFHFMQAFWYRLLVDINRDEIRRRGATRVGADAPAKVPVSPQ